MDVREKLEVIAHLGDHISYKDDIGIFYDSALAKVIEDAYMTLKNGVTVQTNADRIRAMNDEELAEWMAECNAYGERADASQWLPWLKQPEE